MVWLHLIVVLGHNTVVLGHNNVNRKSSYSAAFKSLPYVSVFKVPEPRLSGANGAQDLRLDEKGCREAVPASRGGSSPCSPLPAPAALFREGLRVAPVPAQEGRP
jgi:hypothetical protein